MNTKIGKAANALPDHVLDKSGAMFYSGPTAFRGKKPIYILGLNPGGDPSKQQSNTVRSNYSSWVELGEPYSSYIDEVWSNPVPGNSPLQLRMRHLAQVLGVDLRHTPASNVVFNRSTTEAALRAEKAYLIDACWPVHQAVIETLGVRAVICLGQTAGWTVRQAIDANLQLDAKKETNDRGWVSTAHRSSNGLVVFTLTHPARADWRNEEADPSPMVLRVMNAENIEF